MSDDEPAIWPRKWITKEEAKKIWPNEDQTEWESKTEKEKSLDKFIFKGKFLPCIPDCAPSPNEVAQQMRFNADIIMEEITKHVDKELKRFKQEMDIIPSKPI